MVDIIISAFIWALYFAIFFVILLNIAAYILKLVSRDIIDISLENERRKFNNLEKLSEEIDAIEKSINERSDNLKLMIAELRLEKCRKAYRASKRNTREREQVNKSLILKGTLESPKQSEGLASPRKHPDMNFFKFQFRSE